jgi:hypothetical protein
VRIVLFSIWYSKRSAKCCIPFSQIPSINSLSSLAHFVPNSKQTQLELHFIPGFHWLSKFGVRCDGCSVTRVRHVISFSHPLSTRSFGDNEGLWNAMRWCKLRHTGGDKLFHTLRALSHYTPPPQRQCRRAPHIYMNNIHIYAFLRCACMGWICMTRRGGRRFYHLIIFRVRASQREMIFTGEMNNERARFCFSRVSVLAAISLSHLFQPR